MKNPISILLIVVGLALGIYGAMQLDNSKKSVEVLGLEVGVKDEGSSNAAYMMIGLGMLSLVGGVVMSRKK